MFWKVLERSRIGILVRKKSGTDGNTPPQSRLYIEVAPQLKKLEEGMQCKARRQPLQNAILNLNLIKYCRWKLSGLLVCYLIGMELTVITRQFGLLYCSAKTLKLVWTTTPPHPITTTSNFSATSNHAR